MEQGGRDWGEEEHVSFGRNGLFYVSIGVIQDMNASFVCREVVDVCRLDMEEQQRRGEDNIPV